MNAQALLFDPLHADPPPAPTAAATARPGRPRRRPPQTDLPPAERPATGIEVEQLQDGWYTHIEPILEHAADPVRREFFKWLAREQKRWH